MSGAFPDYFIVNSPQWFIREYHKFFPDKITFVGAYIYDLSPMWKYCCLAKHHPSKIFQKITIHKSKWVSIGPVKHWDTVGLFQLQIRITFPFLQAKNLRTSLLIMRTCSSLTLLYLGGTYTKERWGVQSPPPVLPPLHATETMVSAWRPLW